MHAQLSSVSVINRFPISGSGLLRFCARIDRNVAKCFVPPGLSSILQSHQRSLANDRILQYIYKFRIRLIIYPKH